MIKGPDEIRDLVKGVHNLAGNFEPFPAILPDRIAPVIRTAPDGERELLAMRWGFTPHLGPGPYASTRYLTNIRNPESRFWRTRLEMPVHRCIVPATSFAVRINRAKPWELTCSHKMKATP